MENSHRIEYLDIMKGIAIILVVIGHCCDLPAHPTMLVRFIYAFHMPLFFLAAGMVTKPRQDNGLFVWHGGLRRFLSLMVPYFVWCLIYMDCTTDNIGKMFYASFQSIKSTGAECRQMWFLPCLFVAEYMINFILTLSGRLRKVPQNFFLFVIAVLSYSIGFLLPKHAGGYPFCMDISFVALGIMLMGYMGRKYISRLDAEPFRYQLPLFVVSAIMLYVGVVYGSDGYMMTMCISSYGPIFWFMWNACFGVIMVRTLSSVIAKIGNSSHLSVVKRSALWTGRNTVGIYLVHMPLCYAVMNWMNVTLGISTDTASGNIVVGITVTAMAVILTVIISSLCPQMLGRRS